MHSAVALEAFRNAIPLSPDAVTARSHEDTVQGMVADVRPVINPGAASRGTALAPNATTISPTSRRWVGAGPRSARRHCLGQHGNRFTQQHAADLALLARRKCVQQFDRSA